MITLIGGWVYWLFRGLRNDMRANIQNLENKMDRNHQATLTLLQGHTHDDD